MTYTLMSRTLYENMDKKDKKKVVKVANAHNEVSMELITVLSAFNSGAVVEGDDGILGMRTEWACPEDFHPMSNRVIVKFKD